MILRHVFNLGILVLMCYGNFGCQQGQWEALFNGENLDGWTLKCIEADRGKVYWSVGEGCIVCNSMGDKDHNYVWLCSDREFSDFNLKLKFQIFRESSGNSGVQFRSRYDESPQANFGGWLNGPQVDIHGPAPFRTGLIYDETKGVRRWIHLSLPDWKITPEQAPESALETSVFYFEDDPESWNSMAIICRGMTIQTLVNGNQVTDSNGECMLYDEIHQEWNTCEFGSIALQLHMNDELKIKFKDIVIKEFSQ